MELYEFTTEGATGLSAADLNRLLGRLNAAPFCGGAPGTIRFDGWHIQSVGTGFGAYGRFHFTRNGRPWYDPAGAMQSANFEGLPTTPVFGGGGGGEQPYDMH